MLGETNATGTPRPPVYPFSTCTDEQFLAMAQALQAGKLIVDDLDWQVGDTRNVGLSAFTSFPDGSAVTQAAQTAQLVILHVQENGVCAGKQFTDGSIPSYIIGFKDNVAKSYWKSRSPNVYADSYLKTVENNIYNALPADIKAAFKQFKAITGVYSGRTYATYNRYMCSPAEAELFGSRTDCILSEFDRLTANAQFDYYKTTANRVHSNLIIDWWERSPFYYDEDSACLVGSGGGADCDDVDADCGVCPFGCI